ncbi:MAG: hypothetical protein K8J09_00460 [Planctomycetes bacterium]|nr:hypothetical protein [Planctomycetota bacterium]MCC7395634.1 hypothetical protein [Planctomycetota bacterium]
MFVAVHPDGLRVVEHRDKPDAVVRTNAGDIVGVEVTELLLPDDGRDRSLEGVARAGIEQACRELLVPSGDVDVRMPCRPADRAQVQRWLAALRAWLAENRATILERGSMGRGVFPPDDYAEARVAHLRERGAPPEDVAEAESALAAWSDLQWLHVHAIHLAEDANGWHAIGTVDTDHFADRHEHDIDAIIADAVASKIAKATGYTFTGPLWILLRSPVHAMPSDDIGARIAGLPDINRIDEVWLLDVPANTIDAARPPTVRRIFRRT